MAESFWSVSDWSPVDWTGLTSKTRAVPVLVPLPGVPPCAGAPSASPVTRQAVVAARTVDFFGRWVMWCSPVCG